MTTTNCLLRARGFTDPESVRRIALQFQAPKSVQVEVLPPEPEPEMPVTPRAETQCAQIVRFLELRGEATTSEVADYFNMGTRKAAAFLSTLLRLGRIQRTRKLRGTRMSVWGSLAVEKPMRGAITATLEGLLRRRPAASTRTLADLLGKQPREILSILRAMARKGRCMVVVPGRRGQTAAVWRAC